MAARVLKSLDIDADRCRNEILSELDPTFSGEEAESWLWVLEKEKRRGKIWKTPALKAFGRDLTEIARKEKWIQLWVGNPKFEG